MFVLARAITYSALYVGLLLVFLPAQLLSRFGVPAPARIGAPQIIGAVVAVIGFVVAIACVLTFVFVGRGTAAPFDPPRRLVVRGPYRLIRNPMYLGSGLALLGAAAFYESVLLAGYAAVYFLAMHLLVVLYEEPTLKRIFGADYEAYVTQVGRWLPSSRGSG